MGILSTWDVENNATRVLAAVVRQAGHHCTEIYFKDWISNHLDPASAEDLEALGEVIRRQELNILCISIRASAYAQQSIIITEYVQREFEIPVLWGGMHPTMEPEGSVGVADMVLNGEGEPALLDLVQKLAQGDDELPTTKNVWFNLGQDEIIRNPVRELVENLDSLPFRDYTTEADKSFYPSGSRY